MPSTPSSDTTGRPADPSPPGWGHRQRPRKALTSTEIPVSDLADDIAEWHFKTANLLNKLIRAGLAWHLAVPPVVLPAGESYEIRADSGVEIGVGVDAARWKLAVVAVLHSLLRQVQIQDQPRPCGGEVTPGVVEPRERRSRCRSSVPRHRSSPIARERCGRQARGRSQMATWLVAVANGTQLAGRVARHSGRLLRKGRRMIICFSDPRLIMAGDRRFASRWGDCCGHAGCHVPG
jgi:hypothetical protein